MTVHSADPVMRQHARAVAEARRLVATPEACAADPRLARLAWAVLTAREPAAPGVTPSLDFLIARAVRRVLGRAGA